ncbi:MAG: hypothetical protein ACO1OB_28070, partial [Archangium sp.]
MNRFLTTARFALLASSLFWLGCEPPPVEPPPGPTCGDHGHAHDDHCHCDRGYTEVDGVCVVKPPADGGQQVDACGPHGEQHDDHCHCDAGYEEVGGTCVAVTGDAGVTDAGVDMCGPHGHAHDDHCHCDAGYEEVGGTCVAITTDAGMTDAGVDMCGPHGHSHDDHCHCDAGYEEVGGTCVAVTTDAGVTDAGADPCAPNGELHGNHCHCDNGYIEMGLSCVPVTVVACGNGHRHGSTCVCYAGFIYSAANDTCEPVVPPATQPTLSFTIVALGEDMTSSGMNAVNDSRQVVGNKRPTGQTYLSAYTQSVTAFMAGAVTDVGILPNSSNNFSRPWDLNASGVIVGESGNNTPVLPFVYDSAGLRQLALPTGSTSAVAHGINDAGQIVGIGNSRAIVWTNAMATPTYLANLTGATVLTSRAWKVNEHGDIVGHTRDLMGSQRAAWRKSDGTVVD